MQTLLHRLLPKPPTGPLPLALPRRRIYILPSRFGLVYGAALFFLLIGSLNYNNNAAILLSLVLAATALASSVSNVFFLSGLRVGGFRSNEVFAGDDQGCRLWIRAHTGPVRGEVTLRLPDGRRIDGVAEGDGALRYDWTWPSSRRGRRRLGRITISSGFPLGLFHAWCALEPEIETIVYPTPESPPAPLPQFEAAIGDRPQPQAGSDEWHALREFQRGDSLREIAWKTSARHDRWLVHETQGGSQMQDLVFCLEQVAHLERERAISRLCRWLLIAESMQRSYRLDLDGRQLGPDRGPEQRRRTLTALANLP